MEGFFPQKARNGVSVILLKTLLSTRHPFLVTTPWAKNLLFPQLQLDQVFEVLLPEVDCTEDQEELTSTKKNKSIGFCIG